MTTETKNCKNRILHDVNQHYNKYFDTYKTNYNGKYLNKRDEQFFEPNQFKILGKKKQRSKSTEENAEKQMQKSESTEEKNERERERESCKNHYGLK